MFSSNGIYLIVLILCIVGGYNLSKLKRKKKIKEKEQSKEVSDAISAMRKEVEKQLELAKKENEGDNYEEEIVQNEEDTY